MTALASSLHLQVEAHEADIEAASSGDFSSQRKRIWFLQGAGLAGLMLIGVSVCGLFAPPSHVKSHSGSGRPSGHIPVLAFMPTLAVRRSTKTGGLEAASVLDPPKTKAARHEGVSMQAPGLDEPVPAMPDDFFSPALPSELEQAVMPTSEVEAFATNDGDKLGTFAEYAADCTPEDCEPPKVDVLPRIIQEWSNEAARQAQEQWTPGDGTTINIPDDFFSPKLPEDSEDGIHEPLTANDEDCVLFDEKVICRSPLPDDLEDVIPKTEIRSTTSSEDFQFEGVDEEAMWKAKMAYERNVLGAMSARITQQGLRPKTGLKPGSTSFQWQEEARKNNMKDTRIRFQGENNNILEPLDKRVHVFGLAYQDYDFSDQVLTTKNIKALATVQYTYVEDQTGFLYSLGRGFSGDQVMMAGGGGGYMGQYEAVNVNEIIATPFVSVMIDSRPNAIADLLYAIVNWAAFIGKMVTITPYNDEEQKLYEMLGFEFFGESMEDKTMVYCLQIPTPKSGGTDSGVLLDLAD